MRDVHEAYDRFRRNNPGLTDKHLTLLVDHGIEEDEDGISWKWDARVDSIWTTFSHADSEAGWVRIHCPVLIVTGEFSLDYWAAHREELRDAQDFYESELRRREAIFPDAVSIVIPGAGHMLHYDRPERLASDIRAFIES
jgi:pimeloyl-ACP methyl ester carboxylesterase